MYKSFFHLARNPFDLTPNPESFVATRRHNEALAALYYAIRQHRGFVVVTGEVGTGKTMLLRCLLNLLRDSQDVAYAYLFNSRMSPTEFLQYTLADFGIRAFDRNKSEILFTFGQFLIERAAKEQTTVLIVDEAHHLSDDLLEEIRLLSNLETTNSKLLQIALVGQPELDLKLDSVHLRQLKQRIAVRTHLGHLDLEETSDYIVRRLQIAGAEPDAVPIFTAEAVEAIHRYSKGLPRTINILCENSLIAAYACGSRTVSREMVGEVAAEYRMEDADDGLRLPAAADRQER